MLRPTEPKKDLWKDLVGKPAPEIQSAKGWLFGPPTRIADLRGKHILIHFWNTQSAQQIPVLQALRTQFSERDLAILVMYPDYGGTIPGTRVYLDGLKQQWWISQEPTFPFILDSGKNTQIPDTEFKAMGATHAA